MRTVKSCSNERCFGCENERLLRVKRKAFCKWKTFWFAEKGCFFSSCKANRKRKAFFSTPQQPLRTAPKLTSNCKFYPRQPTVSLQYNNPFSKKHQSCVCTTVTLSHRFKAFSPAFCGQNRFRQEPPENFTKSFSTEL